MLHRGLSRRKLLHLAAVLPFGAILAACSKTSLDSESPDVEQADSRVAPIRPEATARTAPDAPPTATPEPFIIPAGEQQSVLMPGTQYETPLHVFGTGRLGSNIMVLGGVHGNEPAGWLAAERLVEQTRPETGGLLLIPRANRQAVALFERTTDDLGDLNRLYPGDPNGVPMAQMAYEIVETLRRFHVTHLIDLHESWAFYRDRSDTATGTAYLGQTLSARGEPGSALANQLVETINTTYVQATHEEFTFREWPPRGFAPFTPTPGAPGTGTPTPGFTGYRGGRSSLGLPTHIPGLTAILVEMGQQQDMERRIQLHVDIVQEALTLFGTTT